MGSQGDMEILDFIHELWPNFQISQYDLDHPTAETVIPLYQKFHDSFEEINERMLNQRNSSISPFNYTNTHEYVIALFRYVNRFIRNIPEIENKFKFTITDLVDPTAKRTKARLTVLLNFLIFYESKADVLKNCVQRKMQLSKDYQNKLAEKKNLQDELAKQAEELSTLQDAKENLKRNHRLVLARYESLQAKGAEKELAQKKIKAELKTLVETNETKQLVVSNLETNLARLNDQVMLEDSYKSQLELKRSIIEKSAQLELDWQTRFEQLVIQKPHVQQFQITLDKLVHVVSCDESLIKQRETMIEEGDELESLVNKLDEKKYMVSTFEEKEVQLQNSTEEKTAKKKSGETKCKAMLAGIKNDIQLRNTELDKENAELSNQKMKDKQLISELKEEVSRLEKETQNIHQVTQDTYKKCLEMANKVTKKYHDGLNNINKKFS